MHILTFLSFIISGSHISAEWNTKDYMKREHSLIKPYQGSGMSIPYWDFMGSTMVTNNYVRLTPDLQSKQGSLWNTQPCHVRNWELQVHFRVHGKGKDLFGDGFAIWYAKERMGSGPVFGNADYFQGLAVIIDTYSNHNGPHNHQHPYISAMVNNGTLHYDHDRDGTHTQLAGCEAKLRNLPHDTHISIRYEQDTLTVEFQNIPSFSGRCEFGYLFFHFCVLPFVLLFRFGKLNFQDVANLSFCQLPYP
ncbi:hypothetical protein J437_LFUL001626 [Ladona fulva]|uniref:L-type lectin-like domain-containing protein n=1 Tax=Ladona fulva TaxID=123851 RepID=A0A8K0JYF5_LADFU|nr:hypothetical protein J437_LFUL001626 [Ladona fulva]